MKNNCMITHYLFPHTYKKFGFLLIVLFTPLLILNWIEVFEFSFLIDKSPVSNSISEIVKNNGDYNLEVFLSTVLIGLALISFSKFRIEDELTNYLRSKALFYAFTIELLCVLFSIWSFHGINFALVMCYFTLLPIILYTLLLHFFYYYNQFKNK